MQLTRARTPIARADDLDTLSAIWILSCIDENPILTYRGITFRLGLPDAIDVRGLVLSRSELFRPGVLPSRLKKWKDLMKEGKMRPGWISEMPTEEERLSAIKALTRNDVFRSQFRAAEGAPKSDIEIIDWGLNHIERLRKSAAEEREERSRRIGTIATIGSLIVAGLAILTNGGLQWLSMREQRELKQYEVSFKPKQEGYSTFMSALTKGVLAVDLHERADAVAEFNRMESAYFLFEPFLPTEKRSEVFTQFGDLSLLVQGLRSVPPNATLTDETFKELTKKMTAYKVYFQNELYNDLFK
jgi:hypothetical protein